MASSVGDGGASCKWPSACGGVTAAFWGRRAEAEFFCFDAEADLASALGLFIRDMGGADLIAYLPRAALRSHLRFTSTAWLRHVAA